MDKRLAATEQIAIVGKGAFGEVAIVDDRRVRKIFSKTSCLVQEAMALTRMSVSPYIVGIESINLPAMSITMQRWDCSLRDLVEQRVIPYRGKMKIFKCVMMGLSHIHRVGMIHCDVKLSNILVNKTTYDACLCDLGLSSISKYAKICQTAEKYSPHEFHYSPSHDMFGLCVSMLDMFGTRLPEVQFKPPELRSMISALKGVDASIKRCLALMCPDDPSRAIKIDEAILMVFNVKSLIRMPEVVLHENSLGMERIGWLKSTVSSVCQSYRVNNSVRCYESVLNFLNSERGKDIETQYWPIYVSSAIFIYSSLFGTGRFDERAALREVSSDIGCTKDDIYKAVSVLISDNNFVNMSLLSSSKA